MQDSKGSTLTSDSSKIDLAAETKDATEHPAAKVWAIFPPDEGKLDLAEFAPIVYAQQGTLPVPPISPSPVNSYS